MTSQLQLDDQIRAYLVDGPANFPLEWRDEIAAAAGQTAQRRPLTGWRAIPAKPWLRFAAAVLAIGLLAMAVSRLVDQPQVGPPTTVTPWTPDAMREPFPELFRTEPSGGSGLVDAIGESDVSRREFSWLDPVGDGQPGTDPRVDLVKVAFSQPEQSCYGRPNQLCLYFEPAQPHDGPRPDPDTEWLSYGLVLDRDGDGQADGRFGLDNIPGGFFRAWWTDPLTGATKFQLGSWGTADGAYGESEFPRAGTGTRLDNGYMWLSPGLVGTIDNPHGQFYMWAALIRGDEVVSLDFAPDAGWLGVPSDD